MAAAVLIVPTSRRVAKTDGFTLLELIIALAIMTILISMAYPLYDQQTQRARRTDAQTALHLIALAQERYYTAQGAYTTDLTALDITPALQSGTSENGYYTLAMTNNDNDQIFRATATAAGAQSSDANCHVFSLNQLGMKSAQDTDGAESVNCW